MHSSKTGGFDENSESQSGDMIDSKLLRRMKIPWLRSAPQKLLNHFSAIMILSRSVVSSYPSNDYLECISHKS